MNYSLFKLRLAIGSTYLKFKQISIIRFQLCQNRFSPFNINQSYIDIILLLINVIFVIMDTNTCLILLLPINKFDKYQILLKKSSHYLISFSGFKYTKILLSKK